MEKPKKSAKKILILYIPVVHRGYLELLTKYKSKVDKVYIVQDKFVNELYKYEPNIAALTSGQTKKLLYHLGYAEVRILTKNNLDEVRGLPVLLVRDEISNNLQENYLKSKDVQWESAFLRWDRQKVFSEDDIDVPVSKSVYNINFMTEAYAESLKSGDWWRQVGAVLVKKGKIILKAYNQGIPSDNSAYQVGALRDYLEVGEKPEISSTIHAEQKIIADAARDGVSVKGACIYITHFPCSVCAKLIVESGISSCYFSEGSSNADGELVLKSSKCLTRKCSI